MSLWRRRLSGRLRRPRSRPDLRAPMHAMQPQRRARPRLHPAAWRAFLLALYAASMCEQEGVQAHLGLKQLAMAS